MSQKQIHDKTDPLYFDCSREKVGEIEYLVCKLNSSDSRRLEEWKNEVKTYLYDQYTRSKDIALALIDLSDNTSPLTDERKLTWLSTLSFAEELKFKAIHVYVVYPHTKRRKSLINMFTRMINLSAKFSGKKYVLKIHLIDDINTGRKEIFKLLSQRN